MTERHQITTKKIMDVGAGVGHLSCELAKEGYSVIAIEGDESYSQKCVQNTAANPEVQCITKLINDEIDLNVIQEPCISVALRTTPCYRSI